MVIVCRTCSERDGTEHRCHRVTTVFTDEKGNPLANSYDKCPCCGGESSKVTVPVEQKLWLMENVDDKEYEQDKDGNKVLKDWARGELEARIAAPAKEDDPDAKDVEAARQRKRAQAQAVRAEYGTQLPQHIAARIVDKVNEGAMLADADASGLVLVTKKPKVRPEIVVP